MHPKKVSFKSNVTARFPDETLVKGVRQKRWNCLETYEKFIDGSVKLFHWYPFRFFLLCVIYDNVLL